MIVTTNMFIWQCWNGDVCKKNEWDRESWTCAKHKEACGVVGTSKPCEMWDITRSNPAPHLYPQYTFQTFYSLPYQPCHTTQSRTFPHITAKRP
ncbi:hypothetical protein K458DRAFT_66766 [Lentithecium fluviatile CBS 122367]|uniref:Uncharacterized protein n=1 Tax=Lentithecium fluviatile CBS 122367 TaxID=1168545 RepID=A0A6G1JLF9_9PLEO|nr:hypothetical protein K458DRAFT_66766 [Lentithecium fluviatile CBS 122367]